MTNFLLEILSEEIPAKMQKNAAENFTMLAFETLTKAGIPLKNEQVKTLVSPRRLSLCIENLNQQQATPTTKRIGPKIDADKKAVEGFLRSTGLSNEKELTQIEHNGSLCFFFEKPANSIQTAQILQENLPIIIQKMVGLWPKIMRFDVDESSVQAKWIRPVRNILCIFGEEIIPLKFAGLNANNFTYGHFLHSQQPLLVKDPQHYKNILRDNFVIVDQHERKEKITQQIRKIIAENSLKTIDDEAKSALFDEVNGLCEWPTALVGKIDQKFMSLPEEILILTLKLNQKYFCLKSSDEKLVQKFIFIANSLISEKHSAKIIADNEKIVRARLSDAQFFIDEDLKTPLLARLDGLKNITFHKKLGSVYERVERIENLGELLSIWIPHCDISLVEKTALLCKTDLTTKAVAELPELQGKIGSFYARAQGKNEKICKAIYEHYLPLGPNSELPQTPLGAALAIADKIDAIVGLFLANEKPTSSKDPFALRRSALGVIRIFFTYNINLPLRVLINKSLKLYKPKLLEKLLQEQMPKSREAKKELSEEIIRFFFERLKNFLKETHNIRTDILNAVIDDYTAELSQKKYCDMLIIAKKATFVNELVSQKENEGLIKIYKRSANVLAIEERNDKRKYNGKASILGLKTNHEKVIKNIIKKINAEFKKLTARGDFRQAFDLLRLLEKPLMQFFDNVVVNDKSRKLRENRLLLLAEVRAMFNEVVDLSKIEI